MISVVEKLVTVFAPEALSAFRLARDPIAFAKSVLKPAVEKTPSGLYRTIVRDFIPEFYKAGLSANRTIELLRDVAGRAYRRTDFLADWRERVLTEEKKDTWKYVRYDYKITEKTAIPTSRPLSTKYQYIVEHEFLTKEGTVESTKSSVWSDEPLSKKEILERATLSTEKYGVEVEAVRVLSVELVGAYYRV